MSSCSTSLPPARLCSPPLTSSVFSMLDTAAEQMMVHKDFPAAFDTCNTGLESLSDMELEDNRWTSYLTLYHLMYVCITAAWMFNVTCVFLCVFCLARCAEFKAGFCILGIQALAEMNQWQGVLSWVLQQYEEQEKIPSKIMQMWWVELKHFDLVVDWLPVLRYHLIKCEVWWIF